MNSDNEIIKKPSVYFYIFGAISIAVVGFFLSVIVFSFVVYFGWDAPNYIFNKYAIFLMSLACGVIFSFLEYSKELKKYVEYEDGENIKAQSKINAKINHENRLRKIEEDEKRIRMENERKRIEKEKYENMLKEIEDLEAAKSRGKARGLSELYRTQIELMIKYKKEGGNIEKEIFSMRKELLSLEREENNAMVQELIETLDRL